MMEPDWSDFKIILALARAGSVAGAARLLEVDHSTVSRRLSALETSLGTRLVVRGGRELTWTPEGRSVLGAAETMEAAVAGMVQSIRAKRLDTAGAVRLSCPPGFVELMMRLLLPTVREKYPLLELTLSGDYRTVDLGRGEADLAVRMSRPTEPDLVARRAVECGWYVFASRSYLAKQGRPATFDDIAQHQLVLYVESMHNVAPLRWMEAYRGPPSMSIRVDNLEVACQLMHSGSGLGVVPSMLADTLPELVRVFEEPVAFNTGWIVYHESARDTARLRATVELLVDFFEAHQEVFTGQKARPA